MFQSAFNQLFAEVIATKQRKDIAEINKTMQDQKAQEAETEKKRQIAETKRSLEQTNVLGELSSNIATLNVLGSMQTDNLGAIGRSQELTQMGLESLVDRINAVENAKNAPIERKQFFDQRTGLIDPSAAGGGV